MSSESIFVFLIWIEIDHHQSRKLGQICLQRIKEIYEFMVTEGEFDKIRLMQDVVASLAEQVVECTNFVEKYPYLACLCRTIIFRPSCMFEPVS